MRLFSCLIMTYLGHQYKQDFLFCDEVGQFAGQNFTWLRVHVTLQHTLGKKLNG